MSTCGGINGRLQLIQVWGPPSLWFLYLYVHVICFICSIFITVYLGSISSTVSHILSTMVQQPSHPSYLFHQVQYRNIDPPYSIYIYPSHLQRGPLPSRRWVPNLNVRIIPGCHKRNATTLENHIVNLDSRRVSLDRLETPPRDSRESVSRSSSSPSSSSLVFLRPVRR